MDDEDIDDFDGGAPEAADDVERDVEESVIAQRQGKGDPDPRREHSSRHPLKGRADAGVGGNFEGLHQYHDEARRNGTTIQNAMRDYVDVENRIRQDPIAGVAYMAQRLGIDPRVLAAHMYNTYHGQQAPRATQQASDQYAMSQITNDIAAFERDPANRYFQRVRQDMAQLVQNGHASDLKSAYKMAINLHPQLRVQSKMDRLDAKRDADMAKARKMRLR